jgi:hypothetical protein
MQSKRSLLILGGLTFAMTLAAAGVSLFSNDDTVVHPGGLAFPNLAGRLANIDTLDITSGDAHFVLQRKSGTWVSTDKDGYPANNELVTELLIGLSRLTLEEPRTADPSLYGRLEVRDPAKDAPSIRVALKANGVDAADLIVGKQRLAGLGGGKEARYVRKSDSAQAWLASGTLKLEKDQVRWLQRTVIDINHERVAEARLEGPDRRALVVSRPSADVENFSVEKMPSDRKIEQAWRVNNVASALELLDFEDVRADSGSGTSSGTARFTTFDGLTASATLVTLDDRTWLRLQSQAAESAADAVKRESDILNGRSRGWLFRVPSYKEERFTATIDSVTTAASGS